MTQQDTANVDRTIVNDISKRMNDIKNPDTALEVGRQWLHSARQQGLTADQVRPLVDETFGRAQTGASPR